MARLGRRSLLTPALQKRICAQIRRGVWDYVAARACGISQQTFANWMARGRGTSSRSGGVMYVNFVKAVDRAEAEGRALAEMQVRKTKPDWYLARKYPEWSGTTEEEKESRRITVTIDIADTAAQRIAQFESIKSVEYLNGDKAE